CEHYSLHPLLQTFCREEQDRMGCAEEGTQARRAFTLHYLKKLENICRKFVSKDFQLALKDFEHDGMNIQQALENSIKFQCKDIEESCINACNNSVNFLGKIMPPRQCLEIYHRLYDMSSSQKNTRQMAECLASLGFVHLCDGNHRTFSKEAMESFEEAYKLFKIVSKSKRKSEAFAHCLSKLGLCYIAKGIEENEQKKGQQKKDPPKRDRPKGFQQMGDRQKGKKLMQDAIDLRKELGDQVYLAASHCDRAIAARLIGEHSQAITILKEECYPIYKDNLGDHPWVATVLNYISDSYKVLGKLEDAKENTKKSLDIRKRTLGDHQDTARSYVHLAELLRLQGQDYLSGALENYQKALSIQEKVLGVDKETAASCKAIAEILEEFEPENVPEMKKRADSFTEAIKKRATVQRQISHQQNETANSHLQKEKLKWKLEIIVVVFTILVSLLLCLRCSF
ncbi:nephrocystin-3, partial [Exaiptasia diaphana]|uniref:Uncharacterized protein n=2 Tax=Exaiptasia diaphana TaxID=2652724 RepID=A0A913XQR3_EXADI